VAYTYLKQLSLLKVFLAGKKVRISILLKFYVRGLFPKAVNIVENEVNFEKTFGFKVNLASLNSVGVRLSNRVSPYTTLQANSSRSTSFLLLLVICYPEFSVFYHLFSPLPAF